MKFYKMWINGKWVESESGETREIIDPATGDVLASVPEGGASDTQAAVVGAREAFDHGPWRGMRGSQRSRYLFRLAELIEKEADCIALLETLNTGKPIKDARREVSSRVRVCQYYGRIAEELDRQGEWAGETPASLVVREPIGVVGIIIPWNFPFEMAVSRVAVNLAAGNTCVLKPSELTPVTALELAALLEQLQLPSGVVNVVTGSGEVAGAALARHPLVDKISFTGGTETGRKIIAAAAENVKKFTLELGGKSANIVCADAPFEEAVDKALFAFVANQGQVCTAGSRLLLERVIYNPFVSRLLEKVRGIRIGRGIDADTDMGPLISADHRSRVERYVELGRREGAKLLVGGHRPTAKHLGCGFFYEPTIFEEVDPRMRIAQEEIFGPVLCVIPFESEEEAIHIANDSIYGLAGAVWTTDLQKGWRMVRAIRAGTVWLNTYREYSLDGPRGGFKQSGFGREGGWYDINEHMELKQIQVRNVPH